MGAFEYVAVDTTGRERKGVIETQTPASVEVRGRLTHDVLAYPRSWGSFALIGAAPRRRGA